MQVIIWYVEDYNKDTLEGILNTIYDWGFNKGVDLTFSQDLDDSTVDVVVTNSVHNYIKTGDNNLSSSKRKENIYFSVDHAYRFAYKGEDYYGMTDLLSILDRYWS